MDNYAYNISSSYPESGNSSPRSREIEFENPPPWEDASQQTTLPANFKVKFMCSYGGKIQPRPHDNLLSYIGGETKILAVDRSIKFASLLSKLVTLCEDDTISFKYQLPGEDLDSLISVTSDDDLEHMMQEYDRLYRISPKPARLRLFVFPNQNPSRNSSVRSFGSEDGVRISSEKERFVEALNSAPLMTTPPHVSLTPIQPPIQPLPVTTNNVDFLFGTEKTIGLVDPVQVPVPGLDDPIQKHIHDLQRLRLEEQQATNYRRKSEDNNLVNSPEYYRVQQEKVPVSGGVPYGLNTNYPDQQQQQQQQQQVYMVPAPTSAYHTPVPVPQMVRQVSGVPTNQGYYAMQRMPSPEMFRDSQQQQQLQQQQQQQQQLQQQQMYNNMITSSAAQAVPLSVQPQKVVNFSEGYGMVRQTSGGGVGPMVADPTTYGQIAYDGRQVMYTSAPQVQYHHQATVGHVSAEMRPGALITEAGGKVVAGRTT